MADQKQKQYLWKIDKFTDISEDSRIGIAGAARLLLGLDIRSDSGLLQVARKTTKHSDATVTGIIKWFEINPSNNDIYMYMGDKILKETGGVYSSVRSIGAGTPNGQGLCDFNGKLYYRTGTTLGTFDYASTWNDSYQTGLTSMTDFAPMCRFKNYLLIANGRYLATVDDLGTYTAQKLKFPPGYSVRSIFSAGSFSVILCMRGSAISDSDEGMIFLWDGNAVTYNDFIPLNGNPHAGISHNNKIVIIAGVQPTIQESLGGMAQVVKTIPRVDDSETAEVYPGAMDIWRNMVHFGVSGGTATNVLRVLYNWGAKNSKFQDGLNPEFPISTGVAAGTGVQITACKKVGTTMRIAWKSGTEYGVDVVTMSATQPTGIYRSLAFDHGSPYVKLPARVMVELAGPLITGESVTIKLSGDPYNDPTFTDTANIPSVSRTFATDGAVRIVELPIVAAKPVRSRDLHVELTLAGSGSTCPSVKRMWVEFQEEQDQL